ncbi:hypothetical protein QTP81_04830 [Alteromonas sp. ASW11-36]|uniref:Uncharacterized protein n=1 Tax=Alteromonas arenosi TaxID=3055817 RepID=A0ABT7SWH2_9ALTE|nr:hypothetical protein [Alteromonas sp. ASW11-36]MDM7859919.1 hypothetical protein [Alteromonas sp. ASW11-36]
MSDNKESQAQGVLTDLEYMRMSGRDRRTTPRIQDRIYRLSVALNIVAWLGLAGALVLFHYARPELMTGLHAYFNIEVREDWSQVHVDLLNILLQACLIITLISVILNRQRSRRQTDRFGVNLVILAVIVVVSLLTLQITVDF